MKDKVALITGANNPQGIGAATALAFAREGAKVVLVYKKKLSELLMKTSLIAMEQTAIMPPMPETPTQSRINSTR